jgi:D-arabinose 1-dehydrogenase-like Zn-dependent alcohol dehydrogenase
MPNRGASGGSCCRLRSARTRGQHNITSRVEMIRMDQINEAYERMLKSDVKYRFVIDMASLK